MLGQLRFLQCDDHVTSGQDSFCVVSKLPIFYVQTACHLYFSDCLEEEDDVASLFLLFLLSDSLHVRIFHE